MAKSVSAGEMRTRITVKKPTRTIGTNGFPVETWTAVFSTYVRCKWVSAHGSDVLENNRLDMGQTATITLRYTALIDETCRVWRETDTTDAQAWEIVSINDPEDRHAFLEITLRRAVKA